MKLTDKDKQILNELQKDCKQSPRDIAKKCGIPTTTIYNRIRKMEGEGIITGYHARVDPKKVGYPTSAIVLIRAEHFIPPASEKKRREAMPRPLEELGKIPEVLEAHATTGENDIIIKILGTDEQDIGTFVVNKLREIKGIQKTTTGIVVFTSKDTHAVEFS